MNIGDLIIVISNLTYLLVDPIVAKIVEEDHIAQLQTVSENQNISDIGNNIQNQDKAGQNSAEQISVGSNMITPNNIPIGSSVCVNVVDMTKRLDLTFKNDSQKELYWGCVKDRRNISDLFVPMKKLLIFLKLIHIIREYEFLVEFPDLISTEDVWIACSDVVDFKINNSKHENESPAEHQPHSASLSLEEHDPETSEPK